MTSNAHKPSEKHTLDEVLKSLQDLMRGELLQDAPKPPPPPKPHYGKVGRPRKVPKPPAEVTAPPTQPATAGPVDVNAVLASLRSLVSHELAPEEGVEPGREASSAGAALPTEPAAPHPESLEVEDALAQADEALSILSDSEGSLAAEPVAAATELIESVAPAPEHTAPSEAPTSDLPASELVATPEATAPVPAAEPLVPPEGLQQEFAFGAVPEAEPVITETLTLELTPTEPAAPDAVLSASPAQEPEKGEASDAVLTPPDVDVPESFDDALAVPADEPQAAAPEGDSTDAEEIVLEALPPPADETAEETTVELTIDGDATPASPTLGVINPETGAASDASATDESLIEFEAPPLPAAEAPDEPPAASPATVDTELLDAAAEPAEPAPGEIEVAEAPGNSIEFERSEPPGASAPAGEPPALGTLGGHMEVDLGDLPVLQDVVVPPPAVAQLNLIEPPLPGADRARELAVRVAAKINIERRKRGEPGIDTKTIHRLQQLLREELEKAGAKGENKPKS